MCLIRGNTTLLTSLSSTRDNIQETLTQLKDVFAYYDTYSQQCRLIQAGPKFRVCAVLFVCDVVDR